LNFRAKSLSYDESWRDMIVEMIRDGKAEHALALLSEKYGVTPPNLRIGTVKGRRKALGCYVAKRTTIYVSTSEIMTEPYVVLHEFYHHLRSAEGKFGGSEKHAGKFALEFLYPRNH